MIIENILDGSAGKDVRDTLNNALQQLQGQQVSLWQIGCKPGIDLSDVLNDYITNKAKPGTVIFVPPLDGVALSSKWIHSKSIVMKSDVHFHGVGGSGFSGSTLTRTTAVAQITLKGASGGVSSSGMITNNTFHGINFHGNGLNSPIIDAQFAAHFYFINCTFRSPGQSPAFNAGTQCQDYLFFNGYFEGGGSTDGSIGVLHLDDTNGTYDGHSQNGRFITCDFESYNGTWLKMFGKGTGPGNSLFKFFDIKAEAPNRSNVFDIDLDQVYRTVIEMRQIVSKGTSGQTKPGFIKATRCEDIFFTSMALNHLSGGATMTNLMDITGTINSDFVLRPTGADVVDRLATDQPLVLSTTNGGLRISSTSLGTVPNQRRLTSVQQRHVVTGTTQVLYSYDAVYRVLARINDKGQFLNSARIEEWYNADGVVRIGADANNHWAGSTVADITGAPTVRINVKIGEMFAKIGYRIGTPTGPLFTSNAGSPEGVISAPPGSLCTNSTTDAPTGSRLFWKSSGTSNIGWVALS